MNNRICSIVMLVTLVTTTTGCSGVRNFLFGRGARCGSWAPRFGNTMQAPCQQGPYASAPCNDCQSWQGDCGCNGYTDNVYGSAYGCQGCQGVVTPGGAVVSDPYLSGGIVEGPIISDTVVGGSGAPGTVQPDDFSARKFDSDGNRILWEEPLPSGATQL